jgi:hypothetical protein
MLPPGTSQLEAHTPSPRLAVETSLHPRQRPVDLDYLASDLPLILAKMESTSFLPPQGRITFVTFTSIDSKKEEEECGPVPRTWDLVDHTWDLSTRIWDTVPDSFYPHLGDPHGVVPVSFDLD